LLLKSGAGREQEGRIRSSSLRRGTGRTAEGKGKAERWVQRRSNKTRKLGNGPQGELPRSTKLTPDLRKKGGQCTVWKRTNLESSKGFKEEKHEPLLWKGGLGAERREKVTA